MPNWCSNNISIVCNNKAKIRNLYQLLKEWTNKTAEPNSWGNKWLGNIVSFSKINEDVSCRGYIDGLELVFDTIKFYTETAWSPAMKMWVLVCKKYLGEDGWDIYYSSIESGEDLYCTNETDYIDKYIIDLWDDNEWIDESCYDASEKYVIELLQEVFNTDEDNVEELLEMLEDMEEQPFTIKKWDYVDINDWE